MQGWNDGMNRMRGELGLEGRGQVKEVDDTRNNR